MHGTSFRALKVTSQVATPGAESAVYVCLVIANRKFITQKTVHMISAYYTKLLRLCTVPHEILKNVYK